MTEQIPLYLGIPLALLCVVVAAAAVVLGIAMWRDRK